MDTLAFFAFSSRAPSSVEPFSPQRTLNKKIEMLNEGNRAVKHLIGPSVWEKLQEIRLEMLWGLSVITTAVCQRDEPGQTPLSVTNFSFSTTASVKDLYVLEKSLGFFYQ